MSGTSLLLRTCEPRDMGAITAIYQREVLHGRASFEVEAPDEAEMARRHQAIVAGGYPYLVAEEQGVLVGYAYASAYRPRRAYAATVENSVYVRQGAQGRGYGRALLAALIEASAERGYRQMVAVIGDSENRASVRLHEALGFAHVGTLRSVGWKHGVWLDTVLMQRALGTGDRAPRDLPPT